MKFSHQRYNEILHETFNNIIRLSNLKGGEYAGDDDRLENFRRNADRLGRPMEQIWAVYVNKHYDAIMQFIKDIATGKHRERLEPLSSRVDDIIVYMLLFKAMLEERDAMEKVSSQPAPASEA